jgi:hypothetical protein
MEDKNHAIEPAVRFSEGVYPSASQARDEARDNFFKILREVCPHLLRALKGELFPIYKTWIAQLGKARRGSVTTPPRSFLEVEKKHPTMAEALRAWCIRFHLVGQPEAEPEWHGSDWVATAEADCLWPAVRVYETLWIWSQPRLGASLLNADPPRWPHKSKWIGRVGGPRKLTIPLPDLEESGGVGEYKRRARKIFESCLQEDFAKHLKTIRRPHVKVGPDHFAWLALRQIDGLSLKAISEWHHRNRQEHVQTDTIRKGVRDTAGQLGLRLRAGTRGRPRKFGDLPR